MELAEIRESANAKQQMEVRTENLLQIWRTEILPHWSVSGCSKRAHDLWWSGLPSPIRSQASLVSGFREALWQQLHICWTFTSDLIVKSKNAVLLKLNHASYSIEDLKTITMSP